MNKVTIKPVVAIVGRPNVGKSVLFNKLVGRREAISKDEPGITRDLNYRNVTEFGKTFTLIDTGGFEPDVKDHIMEKVREQARLAIEEADIIILLMDAKSGVIEGDRVLVSELRKSGKDVIYCVNKIDRYDRLNDVNDFYTLGVEKILPLSSEHGLGLDDLIDELVLRLPQFEEEESDDDIIKVAIVGRPNAGKSSLLNKLLGKNRAIVSEIAGTTRDAIDTTIEIDGQKYSFIDTAGIRKKSKVINRVESYSVMQAIRSIERGDVCLLVVDATDIGRTQDERIAGLIENRGAGCIVVVNKWDLIEEKNTMTSEEFVEEIRHKMPFLSYAPVVFISALTGQRVEKVFSLTKKLYDESMQEFKTSYLNNLLEKFVRAHSHPLYKNRPVKFYFASQAGRNPIKINISTNQPEGVMDSYKRYIVGKYREALKLEDITVRLGFKQKK